MNRIQMSKKLTNCAHGLALNGLDGSSATFGQTIPKLAQLIASEMRFIHKLFKFTLIFRNLFFSPPQNALRLAISNRNTKITRNIARMAILAPNLWRSSPRGTKKSKSTSPVTKWAINAQRWSRPTFFAQPKQILNWLGCGRNHWTLRNISLMSNTRYKIIGENSKYFLI